MQWKRQVGKISVKVGSVPFILSGPFDGSISRRVGQTGLQTNPGGFIDGVSLVSSIIPEKPTSLSLPFLYSINKTEVHHEPAATRQSPMARISL
jgi:hypothetical protein